MRTLYIFLDESGNFDFSPSGTKHFVLSAFTTFDPSITQQALLTLKYKLLTEGVDTEYFHASEDKQDTRDKVFGQLKTLENVTFHFIYADKTKAHPSIQTPSGIYSLFGKTLLKYCFKGQAADEIDQIIVIFDKALTKKDRGAFEGTVKPELKKIGKPFRIYFHQTLCDFNGQIADYAAWSLYVWLERSEKRPYKELYQFKPTAFDIFRTGKTKYY